MRLVYVDTQLCLELVEKVLIEAALAFYEAGRKLAIPKSTPITREILLRAWFAQLRGDRPLTIKTICSALDRTSVSIWRHIQMCIDSGLVFIEIDALDQRRRTVHLTDKGKSMLEAAYIEIMRLAEEKAIVRLGERETMYTDDKNT
jgi:DNA-binding MarR family transcriptional regulator